MVTASTPGPSSPSTSREGRAAEHAGHEFALLAVGIGDADQLDARKIGEHARMVAAHDADADHAYA